MTGLIRAEWTKATSLRGPAWAAVALLVVSLTLNALNQFSVRSAFDAGRRDMIRSDFHPLDSAYTGMLYGQLALVVLVVLLVGGEHSTGAIRSSLLAVPNRARFFLAKATMIGAISLVLGLITVLTAVPLAQQLLGPYGVALDSPGVARTMIGAVLYLTLLGLFTAGVAAMLRGTAVSLGVLIPFFFLVSPLLFTFPATRELAVYLPDQAGQQAILFAQEGVGELTWWQGLLVMAGWSAAALGLGLWSTKARDV